MIKYMGIYNKKRSIKWTGDIKKTWIQGTLGKVYIGKISWHDGECRFMGDRNQRGYHLSFIFDNQIYLDDYRTVEEVKDKAEELLNNWLDNAGLELKK